jgi:hypothetical protein
MKNKKLVIIPLIIFSAFIGTIVVLIFIVITLLKIPCDPPERLASIPISTEWIGGCDGGIWYELVNYSKDVYRIRCYDDNNGRIMHDSDYKADSSCNALINKSGNILNLISSMGENKLYISVKNNGKYCYLYR